MCAPSLGFSGVSGAWTRNRKSNIGIVCVGDKDPSIRTMFINVIINLSHFLIVFSYLSAHISFRSLAVITATSG